MNKKKIKILYYLPNPNTIYAGRTIYYGYKNAFEDLGYEFKTLTPDSDRNKLFEVYNPDIFITSLSKFALKYLDLEQIKKQKDKGMKVFVNIPFWNSPISKLRVNETKSISEDDDLISLIRSDDFGDYYYNVCEQNDLRMDGFEEETGVKFHTIPLAADKVLLKKSKLRREFVSDISFIGTNLPEKRKLFKDWVFPLKNKYDLKLYGQDWTSKDKLLGWAQRGGQYFNVPYIRSIQKPKLALSDEGDIYASSAISINIHEDYQKKIGGDCNERTFKIPLAGGFEIIDDVACIRKYFKEDQEIIIAKNKKDWYDKIDFYIKNPEKRLSVIEAGRKRVLKEHTYHNRVYKLIEIYNSLN